MEESIQGLMERLPSAFQPEKAQGVSATVWFHLTGEKGGDWVVTIADQLCKVEKGMSDYPKLTFTADAQDCLDIFHGKMDGMKAFMQGRLRLAGDMMLAMKLASFFKTDGIVRM